MRIKREPEFIYKKRNTGKTTELIKRSAETGAFIIVRTGAMARYIKAQAKDMGYKIPEPMGMIHFNSIMNDSRFREEREDVFEKGILVDEFQLMIDDLFGGVPVHAVTITDYSESED